MSGFDSISCIRCRYVYLLCVGLTEASVSVLIRAPDAPLCAHSILQHVSLHALQAVGSQRAFTGIAAPVTLWGQDEGGSRKRGGRGGRGESVLGHWDRSEGISTVRAEQRRKQEKLCFQHTVGLNPSAFFPFVSHHLHI